jgi:hypothetical protein
MWYLPESVDDFDLVDAMDAWTESAVDTKYLVVDDDGQGQVVEHIGKVVPNIGVAIFATAFSVEAVRLCYTAGFVVATDEVNSIRVSKLQAYEKGDGFDAEETEMTCQFSSIIE